MEMMSLKTDKDALQKVLNNRNMATLGRAMSLDLASKPLSTKGKAKFATKLDSQENKIAMTLRMIQDLELAQAAFPGKEVQIAVRRFMLGRQLVQLRTTRDKIEQALNPRVTVRRHGSTPAC